MFPMPCANQTSLMPKYPNSHLTKAAQFSFSGITEISCNITCADLKVGRGGGRGSGPPPLENHKVIRFLSKTGPDSLKNPKAIKPEFNDGQLFYVIWILSPPLINCKKKVNVVRVGPTLTKLSGYMHDTNYFDKKSDLVHNINKIILCTFLNT